MEREIAQTRLASYLQAIKAGKLMNFSALVKELTKKSVPQSTIDRCFMAELLKQQKYRVHIVDEVGFNELYERFFSDAINSRTAAALAGNSHRTKVSGSYLLLRRSQHTQPVVVWFEGGSFHCPVVQSRIAILVENLENYISIDQLPILLNRCGISIDINQADIIYASGNRVTNKLHQPFLQQYKQIFCLFDVDLGALKMYQSLHLLLSSTELRFLYPLDIVKRLNVSERRMSATERANLLRYQGLSTDLDQLIRFMRNSGTKLEQETYLDFSE